MSTFAVHRDVVLGLGHAPRRDRRRYSRKPRKGGAGRGEEEKEDDDDDNDDDDDDEEEEEEAEGEASVPAMPSAATRFQRAARYTPAELYSMEWLLDYRGRYALRQAAEVRPSFVEQHLMMYNSTNANKHRTTIFTTCD